MWTWLCGAVTLLFVGVHSEDSLHSALKAVHRRQRDFNSYYTRPYVLGNGQPEDIGYGYQKSVAPASLGLFDSSPLPAGELGAPDGFDGSALERLIEDYLEEEGNRQSKRSVFRENAAYPEALQAVYKEREESPFRERYVKNRLMNAHDLVRNYGGLQDRPTYDEDALNVLNNIWDKYKREEMENLDEADVKNLLEYLYPEENKRYDYGYDVFNSPGWNKRDRAHLVPRYDAEDAFDDRYPYRGVEKRYPIAKRSPEPHRHKKNVDLQTDPKVAKELSAIFQKKNDSVTTTPPSKNETGQKELTMGNALDKPLEIKKKSVKWSDYFGMDRRKKSGRNDWLVQRYLEAYDKPKREDVDAKLRAMEDMIVDEAVKYTGSQEGASDPAQIEEAKEKVIAQLAAAYSLEKMRRALGEFRDSLAVEDAVQPSQHPARPVPTSGVSKDTGKERREKEQQTVKATKKLQPEGGNAVATQPQSDRGLEEGECPILEEIEGRCTLASTAVADKEAVFLPLCVMHQICYLCGGEGVSTPRGCDVALLREAAASCGGEPSCGMAARRLVHALRGAPLPPASCRSPCLAPLIR